MRIIIEGATNSGKSTLARIIEKALLEKGINMTMTHDTDYHSVEAKRTILDKDMDLREAVIVRKQAADSITISERSV